ncbi:unnamed protein product [[Candida] boidinii]|nr:unnamed protein product [[Candida] boidinii]
MIMTISKMTLKVLMLVLMAITLSLMEMLTVPMEIQIISMVQIQIMLIKFETELNIDPLFKKTLAEFDEGGTSALLLNSLHIDIDGRIVFDASTPSRGVGNNDKENPDSSKDKSTARDDDEKAESDTIIDTIKDDGNDGILGGLAMESDLKDEAEGDDGEFEKFGFD